MGEKTTEGAPHPPRARTSLPLRPQSPSRLRPPPTQTRIIYTDTVVRVVGGFLPDSGATLAVPWPPPLPAFLAEPLRALRSATFDTTHVGRAGDSGALRITRGDQGELRIYCRDAEE